MPRRPTVSPERILAVAALEFAARGYAGARVDRIARLAKVNKAMLYYHFGSKQGLYRTILRQTFVDAAARLQAVADSALAPEAKLDRAIADLAVFVEEHSFFPAIMLREVAEGGAHLDRETLTALAALPRVVGAIVAQGVDAGRLRPVHPVAAYFSMFAPFVMYHAGAPIRRELTRRRLIDLQALPPDAFVAHLQESIRRAFALTADDAHAQSASTSSRSTRAAATTRRP